MKTIWKFELPTFGPIEMPSGAVVLDVQVQQGKPCLWALVDPEAPKEKRMFQTYGTGHNVPDNPGKYIGTFQLSGGILIFHVFEEGK